ncbi:DNA-directed RNA polymerase III subunit RPC8, partial [Phenoliferia sp. Uapishka_3]
MFTFCIQKDTIRVEPRDFGKDPVVALREEIHRRYANKILPEVGLCISLLDILDASEGAVLYGDGCFYYKVEFRLIIFRPYIGEALVGKVQSQSEAGISVSVGFFDDILVTPNLLRDQMAFDIVRRAYFWYPDDAQGPLTTAQLLQTPTDSRLYIERRDWVRLRVEEEHWDDSSPLNGKVPPSGELPPGANGEVNPAAAVVPGKAPYAIVCSMAEDGTGVLDWWDQEDDEEEAES